VHAHELFVGVTSFNSELFLDACLGSLRRTTQGVDTRIVVIDNESTDRSRDIAASHRVELVTVRCSQPMALNRLLAMSTGRRTLLIHSDVVLFAPDWYARCESRLRGDVALVSPEDTGCGPLTRPFGIGKPESSFMLFDTRRARAAREWRLQRRFRLPVPRRLLDLDADHVTHRLPQVLARKGYGMHLMQVHPSPVEAHEWYSPPFVPRYWDQELGYLRYGLGNFYSIDGVITHYHNWYDRVPKIADAASTRTTERDGDGLPLAYISLATERFLDDYRAGRVVLPDASTTARAPRSITEHSLRFDISFADQHADA
jgi:glycosyltransferase involved in cell wall biosynthesis